MTRFDSKRKALAAVVVLAAIALCGAGAAFAQDQGDKSGGGMPQMSPEQMQQMMALMQPGEVQQEMAGNVGQWKTTVKMWEGPGEPTVSEGSVTFEMILGGRYLVSHHKGSFMGMPFEGMGIDAYDNGKKEYVSIWVDNFGTGVMYLTGQRSKDGKGVDYVGTLFDPMRMSDSRVREELRHLGSDTWTFTMFQANPDGSAERKVMEMTGVREK